MKPRPISGVRPAWLRRAVLVITAPIVLPLEIGWQICEGLPDAVDRVRIAFADAWRGPR